MACGSTAPREKKEKHKSINYVIVTVKRPKTAVTAPGGALHLDGAVRGEHRG
jgi:hypothetical protein